MKRVKMMLLSLLVLSVVGGAMAFKAKFDHTYCTSAVRIILTNGKRVCTNAAGLPLTCQSMQTQVEAIAPTEFNAWCYTTLNGDTDCDPAPNCRVTVSGLAHDN